MKEPMLMILKRILAICIMVVSGAVAFAASPPPSAFSGAASCPNCTVGKVSQLRLRYSGVEAWATKLFNPQNKTIIPFALMGDGTTVADQEQLKQDDYAARIAKYGKLAPSLGAQLDTLADTDLVDVTIWSNSKV